GPEQHVGELADLLGLDGVDLRHDPPEREQLGVGDQRLAEPGHPARGRLHAEHDPALEVLLRALELARAQVPRGEIGDLRGADLDAAREVLLAGAEVDPDDAGVRVLRGEAVDGVGHAALLADLLEEARRGRAAEDRIEQRRGEAPPVRARDARRADADVVLLGVLAPEADAGRRRLHERWPRLDVALRGSGVLAG